MELCVAITGMVLTLQAWFVLSLQQFSNTAADCLVLICKHNIAGRKWLIRFM